jgi:predicted secreted protein
MLVRQINLNDFFSVELVEKAAAGYRWFLDSKEGLELLNVQRKDPNDHLPYDERPVGGPMVVIFNFRPKTTGEFVLQLSHKRPWEKSTSPIETYEEKVVVS